MTDKTFGKCGSVYDSVFAKVIIFQFICIIYLILFWYLIFINFDIQCLIYYFNVKYY